jgi:hypothetical protein
MLDWQSEAPLLDATSLHEYFQTTNNLNSLFGLPLTLEENWIPIGEGSAEIHPTIINIFALTTWIERDARVYILTLLPTIPTPAYLTFRPQGSMWLRRTTFSVCKLGSRSLACRLIN